MRPTHLDQEIAWELEGKVKVHHCSLATIYGDR